MSRKGHELRAQMKRILVNLDPRWVRAATAQVNEHLCTLLNEEMPPGIEHLLAWVSFFPGEPDLSRLLADQLTRRKVYLPRVQRDRSMAFISVGADWRETVAGGMYGIPEPEELGERYDPAAAAATAVLVPGLAFDRSGNRLGRGGGYYDRFLGRSSMARAVKVGVCWSLQVVDSVPTEAHDIMMDWICDERESLRTGLSVDDGYEDGE